MVQPLPWWFWPLIATFLLITIHTYLGLHVISRKVLFVDLALAQITALGSTVAFLFGFELSDGVTFYVSLLFGIIGAWVFSITRTRGERVPQEAIIGLSFAIASAGSILLSAENPHGAEHLRDILAGSILVVTPGEVLRVSGLYAVIGAVHWFLRKRFHQISVDPEGAAKEGIRVRRWDFLFYVTFALVITMSVHIAGVLLVFCLLIAPAVCGVLFADRFRTRLFIGWGTSVVAATGGLGLSAHYDWPPAPCIICLFAALLVVSGLAVHVGQSSSRVRSLLRIGGGALALVAAGFGMVVFLKSDFAHSFRAPEEDDHAHKSGPGREPPSDAAHSHGKPEHGVGDTRKDLLAALGDEHDNVRAKAAEELGKLKDASVLPELAKALKDPSSAVKEKAAQALGAIGRPEAAPALAAALEVKEEDEWVQLRVAEALVRCGEPKGIPALVRMAREADAKLVRSDALKRALGLAGKPVPKSIEGPEGKAALDDLARWWNESKDRARWDPAARRLVTGP